MDRMHGEMAVVPRYPASNWVMVFGSNLAGRHGKGAALMARKYFGAQPGQGAGLHGHSYALPTKDATLAPRSLAEIRESVEEFKVFARHHPELQFQVTRIACGYAGYSEEEIRPLFEGASKNVLLPGRWLTQGRIRLIVAGGRDFEDRGLMQARLDRLLSNMDPARIDLISGMAKGADRIGWEYAGERGLNRIAFPADWNNLPKYAAGFVRNAIMAWAGTHLVAFWDGKSSGTKDMISCAHRELLTIRVVNY